MRSRNAEYAAKPAEAIMVNWIGVLTIVFCVLVVYLASNSRFKRLNRPEDEMLLNDASVNE